MTFIKKRRHKPLYKKFINLRKNVQNRRKILTFKRRKWNMLIKQIKRLISYRKKNFRMYDLNRYHLPRYYKFKRKFSYNLHTKKRFSLFYGNLLQKYLKKQVKLSAKKTLNLQNNTLKFNRAVFLLKLLESRLDTILYRSHFVLSIRTARQLISHGHVSINNIVIKDSSYILKKGDFITLSPQIHSFIDNNFGNSNLWPIPPKYLQINYKTFQIIMMDNIKNTNFSLYFPFYPNLQLIIKKYSL